MIPLKKRAKTASFGAGISVKPEKAGCKEWHAIAKKEKTGFSPCGPARALN
ncbi:MAG TPA: hypothetical protein VG796_18895 [Verrucomicrobiales bacterium]|jgi:hypothetical protein|nr:hypothetical protein [Verrucomicrobiales bacterium]